MKVNYVYSTYSFILNYFCIDSKEVHHGHRNIISCNNFEVVLDLDNMFDHNENYLMNDVFHIVEDIIYYLGIISNYMDEQKVENI